MDSEYGFLSLLPSLVAILFALTTRRVLLALLLGLWGGYLILSAGDPLEATLQTVSALAATLESASNSYTLLFTFCIGALVALFQYSGGLSGFVVYVSRYLRRVSDSRAQSRVVQGIAACMGALLFVETNLSILTVGMLFRPLFDHLRLSREKLAYICDSTSASSCILLPFNAWGAYIMSVLLLSGFESPLSVLLQSVLFNFYPLLALLLLFTSIFFGFEIGAMRKARPTTGSSIDSSVSSSVDSQTPQLLPTTDSPPRVHNMLLPLSFMVFSMPFFMVYTGWSEVSTELPFLQKLRDAFLQGEGAFSVLLAALFALSFAFLWYRRQRFFSLREACRKAEQGAIDMRLMALLMLVVFALGKLCKTLQTGEYIAGLLQGWISPGLLPLLFFLFACFVSFSTGTSWGTFAIALPLVMPVCVATGVDPRLCVAAVLGGGIFGDHCSPISDTTLISSLAAGCSHINHVRTQLPYALLSGILTALLYLLLGFLM